MESKKTNTPKVKIEPERSQYVELLAKNANYFGTVQGSKLKPVKEISFLSSYEELTAVGYNPDTRNLEATISLKQTLGYMGTLCSKGSIEYVRFFLDYGEGWQDQGLVAVNVHDIPVEKDCEGEENKPLSYTVTLAIQPQMKNCQQAVLPKVRALLSWNVIPDPGNPDFPVVWGNRLETHIQIKPILYSLELTNEDYLNEFFSVAINSPALKFNQVNEIIQANTPGLQKGIPKTAKASLSISDLASLYTGDKKVSPARFGTSQLKSALLSPAISSQYKNLWQSVNLDWEKYLEELIDTSADTTYEKLEALGLDYNLERIIATFRVKQAYGYSGNLCSTGSQEYVAFWADWDDTCEWTYLGTVAVNVHDVNPFPKDGICYSAILPVDLTYHRRECSSPKITRIRAVLSWQVPPSSTDPDLLETWGNSLDTHIQIKPGASIQPGEVVPIIVVLGGIPTDKISDMTGLTTSDASFALTGLNADPLGRACPFGGRVVIQGPSFPGYTYRIQVRPVGTLIWTNVVTPLTLVGWKLTPPYVVYTTNSPDVNGFFDFQDASKNIDNVLGWWDTNGDDLWEVKLEIPLQGEMIKRVQLFHQTPEAIINIDNGGNCKDFVQGDTLKGHFVARADYFGEFSLQASIDPNDISVYDETVPYPGHGWKIDTSNWQPCGYTVYVSVWDRSILNSGPGSHNYNEAHVGFCLKAKS
jgi:hypothetical protein